MTASGDMNGRATPQISANDLALYMVSTETGKLSIIRRHKYPSKHVMLPYQNAKRWLSGFMADDLRDKVKLAMAIEHFEQIAGDGSYSISKREDARRSKQAIETFYSAYNEFDLAKLVCKAPPDRLPPLMIAGVKVNVTLDLSTCVTLKKIDYEGGIIWRLTMPDDGESATSKRDEMGHFVAALAYLQVSDKRPLGREPLAKICYCLDVQHRQKFEARAGSRRISNLEAACRMISSIWPSV